MAQLRIARRYLEQLFLFGLLANERSRRRRTFFYASEERAYADKRSLRDGRIALDRYAA